MQQYALKWCFSAFRSWRIVAVLLFIVLKAALLYFLQNKTAFNIFFHYALFVATVRRPVARFQGNPFFLRLCVNSPWRPTKFQAYNPSRCILICQVFKLGTFLPRPWLTIVPVILCHFGCSFHLLLQEGVYLSTSCCSILSLSTCVATSKNRK